MNKKLQVFVSSTYTDLIEERQAAVQAILDAGHIPAGMELFKAGKSQMKTIRKWIDESDVYMLILGGRYGSIEEETGLSYTELEYKYALSKDMPVFAILLEDSFLFTKAASKGKDTIFEKDNIGKYNAFKEIVKTNIIKFVSNVDQIPSNIHSQLNHILLDSDYNLVGWTRQYNDENMNFSYLINENNLLKKQLQKIQDDYNRIMYTTHNKSIIISEYSEKDPKEISFSSLKKDLSSKRFIYDGHTHTALTIFKMKYIDHRDIGSSTYMQEKNLDKASLYFEKYSLVTREKSTNLNLYRFSLSSRGRKFCNYLCQEKHTIQKFPLS